MNVLVTDKTESTERTIVNGRKEAKAALYKIIPLNWKVKFKMQSAFDVITILDESGNVFRRSGVFTKEELANNKEIREKLNNLHLRDAANFPYVIS